MVARKQIPAHVDCAMKLVAVALVAPLLSAGAHAAELQVTALVGGTVIVTHRGGGPLDIKDAVILLKGDKITAVGPRGYASIPLDAAIVDIAGKFVIPGLIDGFCGMQNQAEANSELYEGVSMHTELEMLVRAGLSPREAPAAATSNYAEIFGWSELGAVEAGRRADVIVLSQDPTKDIANADRIDAVYLAGTKLDHEKLLKRSAEN
jgi:imidazolonepropionase-like amidohydrolase